MSIKLSNDVNQLKDRVKNLEAELYQAQKAIKTLEEVVTRPLTTSPAKRATKAK